MIVILLFVVVVSHDCVDKNYVFINLGYYLVACETSLAATLPVSLNPPDSGWFEICNRFSTFRGEIHTAQSSY